LALPDDERDSLAYLPGFSSLLAFPSSATACLFTFGSSLSAAANSFVSILSLLIGSNLDL
ncbi:MAG: hypothetical protein KAU38_01675, partial [Desulfobacterales bacterium]|nr:hypothetical protein [Desulfobacterales bacterium]